MKTELSDRDYVVKCNLMAATAKEIARINNITFTEAMAVISTMKKSNHYSKQEPLLEYQAESYRGINELMDKLFPLFEKLLNEQRDPFYTPDFPNPDLNIMEFFNPPIIGQPIFFFPGTEFYNTQPYTAVVTNSVGYYAAHVIDKDTTGRIIKLNMVDGQGCVWFVKDVKHIGAKDFKIGDNCWSGAIPLDK